MKDRVVSYAKTHDSLPVQSPVGFYAVEYKEVPVLLKEKMQDTILPDEDDEPKLFRTLTFPVKAGEKKYSAKITRELVESDELIESIGYSLSILTGVVLVVLLLMNWLLSKKLWKPFYRSLDELKKFDLNKRQSLNLPAVKTSEFKIFNEEIVKMAEKIKSDYQNLKEFTENASHEIQTPLAIIRSKLELMIQSENLPEEQVKSIREIYESVNRLSKLNQSLLLLAKIENRQFGEEQIFDLKFLIEKKLGQLKELIEMKEIKVETQLSSLEIKINPHLADILLSNILSNAIKHNINGGKIIIEIKINSLLVSNTGISPKISTEKLFGRFQKSSQSIESVGLGLSIVKQICDTYNFKVDYTYKNEMHIVSISF
jgi:signal transduction histidine kinase